MIIVDWSTSARLSYSLAVSAVSSVGAYVGDLISTLVAANRVELDRLHLIGFDLGAHVVGFAGRRLQGEVARITGKYDIPFYVYFFPNASSPIL